MFLIEYVILDLPVQFPLCNCYGTRGLESKIFLCSGYCIMLCDYFYERFFRIKDNLEQFRQFTTIYGVI